MNIWVLTSLVSDPMWQLKKILMNSHENMFTLTENDYVAIPFGS